MPPRSRRATLPTGTFTAVAAGDHHSCALATDGEVSCWGDNSHDRSTVPGGTFTAVTASAEHSYAIRTGGTLNCWETTTTARPHPPTGTFTAVTAGDRRSCALGTDRTLTCWGVDDDGQIAAPIGGTFTTTSAGSLHGCAVRRCRRWSAGATTTAPSSARHPRRQALHRPPGGGQPQSTAVWYLVDDDGALKTSITTDRQKYRNLTHNPKATLFILDPANPFRTLEIRATVDLAPDADKALLPKFAARYDTPVEMLDIPGARVVATLTPLRVVANG